MFHFGPVDEKKSFTVTLNVFVSWSDNRLAISKQNNTTEVQILEINEEHFSRIWKPKIHFANAVSFQSNILNDDLPGKLSGIIYDDGRILAMKKYSFHFDYFHF